MKKQAKSALQYKYTARDPQGYFVGYTKGKRKKVYEQAERYATPEEAMEALGIKTSAV